ncbi:MAG: 2-hydroxyacid dehydrogenase [Burkholderiaceae bacterium]|nr:2-hydroxyacid dehydrogenase [Burkholderiaceae bacterium]
MTRVLYLSHATPEVYAIIRAAVSPGIDLVTLDRDSDDERRGRLADADIVIVASYPFRRPLIDVARNLKLVHSQGVGYHDTMDIVALRERGIPIALTPEGTTTGVAEHTILLMLAACKLLPFADRELREGRFHINALRPQSREIAGMTIGYVGFGRIGQAVATRLKVFGTNGLYADAAVALDPTAQTALGVRRASLDEVLAAADILSLHLPLTGETRGLISRDAIARMKVGAILVNTARGGIVDEDALADALATGHLAAAGLDVFTKEPPDVSHRLFGMPNVVVTPHISAGTRDALAVKMAAIFANIVRFERGEPILNKVPDA